MTAFQRARHYSVADGALPLENSLHGAAQHPETPPPAKRLTLREFKRRPPATSNYRQVVVTISETSTGYVTFLVKAKPFRGKWDEHALVCQGRIENAGFLGSIGHVYRLLHALAWRLAEDSD